MIFPISSFFQSLSAELQENAFAIVLSVTGSDGSDGIKFIKEKGGFVLVQDPDEAKFNGMPNNAINTGAVDKVCSIENMHQQIDIFFKNSGVLANFLQKGIKKIRCVRLFSDHFRMSYFTMNVHCSNRIAHFDNVVGQIIIPQNGFKRNFIN